MSAVKWKVMLQDLLLIVIVVVILLVMTKYG